MVRDIVFGEATKEDIDELIRLRVEFLTEDVGSVSDYEKDCMEKQLPDYFTRKLGDELIVFVAKDKNRIISVAYLHIIEMPANSVLLNGIYGNVRNVYTKPEYRGRGICTQLINNLVEYGRGKCIGRIDLSASEKGYPIYKKAGFIDKGHQYTEMRYEFSQQKQH